MEFLILGPLDVRADDGSQVALGGRRPRALLAALLLHPNEAVSTDRLIDAVWGDDAPASAPGALQVHIHALRKALGADRIVTRAPGYLVRVGDGELDADRFERLVASGTGPDLAAALALWRGPALADFADEPFARVDAARLDESRLVAMEKRIASELDAGRHADVVGELDALVAAHPHREHLQAQRMLALYRSGRQADALAAYREARAKLDELGLEPSAELRGLEGRILRQAPDLELAPASIPTLRTGAALIGRDLELATIEALLETEDVRLVTLTGPGGIGKTRLATTIAGGVEQSVFVDLAPLTDARLVPTTIGAALELGDISGRELEALAEALAERRRLVVLDNCEHLPESFAVIAALVERVREAKILATSRVPLRVAAEYEYRVPPLAVPDQGAATPADADSAAVRLYVERARGELDRFELTDANAAAVVRICRALDGLPLAIELAAARVRVLGPDGTAKRLGERLALLTKSAPDLPERRRSLRAAIDWSYQLLDDEGRHVMRALAVFAGGATLDALEAVADDGTDVPRALDSLLDASLAIDVSTPGSQPRFGMLETIRQFASEKLEATAEGNELRGRHLDLFVAFADDYETRARSGLTAELMDEVEVERDNIRAALAEAARDPDPERQLRLATALRGFLNVRVPAEESHRIVDDAMARRRGGSREQQGRILVSASIHAVSAGDPEGSLVFLEEARSHFDAIGDVRGLALVDGNASTAYALLGRHEEAIECTLRAIAGFHEVGSTSAEAHAHAKLAQSYEQLDQLERARDHLVAALELLDSTGDVEARGYTLAMLGYLAEREGDAVGAARWTSEAITAHRRLRKDEYLAYALLFTAYLVDRDPRRAATLLGASQACFDRAGAVIQAGDEADRWQRVERAARAALGSAAFDEAETEGAAFDVDAASEYGIESLAGVAAQA